MITQSMTVSAVATVALGLLLVLEAGALPSPVLLEGSGDYDYDYSAEPVSDNKPVAKVPNEEDVLDPIEDSFYPEDDDDYGAPFNDTVAKPPLEIVVPEVENESETSKGSTEVENKSETVEGSTENSVHAEFPVRFGLLESFGSDDGKKENTTGTVDSAVLDGTGSRKAQAVTPAPDCQGFQKLPTQPQFINGTFNVIRMCCPPGESFLFGDKNQPVHCAASAGATWDSFHVQAIVAQFFHGCIEDLEQESPPLGVVYGNPCKDEFGLIRFGVDSSDSLYVIQNGSLLAVNELAEEYDIFNSYCLDLDRVNRTLSAYVCPSEFRIGRDIFKGQMMALALCLVFAIPLLLATAFFYVAVPEFNDIHGKALSMNCINFAIALLLESIFQHQSHGNGSTDETIAMASYADYFVLATFFWLLVNCMNNCIHAWYFLPKGIQIRMRGEKRTFLLYTTFAQLVPLVIILSNSAYRDSNALKHYFFLPIIVIIALNIISFFITFWGFQRVSDIQIQHFTLRGRLSNGGEAANAILAKLPNIHTADVEKVKYMAKYTAMLFMVMAGVWVITIATYYSTRIIPIIYDILFGLQGILIFIIFICLPRPFRTVKAWFQKKELCGCREDPDAIDLRRGRGSQHYRVSNNNHSKNGKESVPLNNSSAS
ncbi:probable G-protein coupled receptor Mth-like 14 [Armigeres subalbatus]|uniref:probable G-protein coupled receptor Mth-like 14 n=1 Tax=Armigeres subalbatus TaxID=124917 RepID=UPI002ED1E39C